jgi:hypothetical protein
MKKLLLFFLLLTSSFLFSQNNYEKGYFINNNNKKIECLIKNMDWLNNPSDFQYKMFDGDDVKVANITNVKYFEIFDGPKYLRAHVKMDYTTYNTNSLTTYRSLDLTEMEIFLKELVVGEANLYLYREGIMNKFFYSMGGGLESIQLLAYKPYMFKNKVAYNLTYQQDLLTNLVCEDISPKMIKNTDYEEGDLVKLFQKYNLCKNPESTIVHKIERKKALNISFKPRANFTNAEVTLNSYNTYDFKNATNASLGIEIEYVLPFNNDSWSVFIDPNYLYYKEKTVKNIDLDYKAIEIPVGVRYGLNITNNSKIYGNLGMVIDVNLNSSLMSGNYKMLDLKLAPNTILGVGYLFKSRYSIELRVATNKDITKNYTNSISSKFSNTSVILGYRIF